MQHWIVFNMIIALIILSTFKGYKKVREQSRKINFLVETMLTIALLLVIYLIDPNAYEFKFFNRLERSSVDSYLLAMLTPIFFIPLIFELLGCEKQTSSGPKKEKTLFGYPIFLLPKTRREFLDFTFYIIVGVIFEEMICRQFLFFYLHTLFEMQGNYLVLWSSIIFALPHLYQGWKGLLSSFVLGLIFGKVFLITGNIVYPICLHIALNATLLVKSWKLISNKPSSKLLT